MHSTNTNNPRWRSSKMVFSILPIEIKSDWKRFTQEFSKMFDSERNKQHKEFYVIKFADYQMKQSNI